ncbi:MAG: hypothetical protein DRJ05_00270 [Bacteroidetes bacterium]|nr:MAG: hypothetical protein DRI89_00070 [Bacteroidota bacterium]RLD62495.1 MAG: hypothetical protein DRJ05_00270 [Bacteroidota bacterium]
MSLLTNLHNQFSWLKRQQKFVFIHINKTGGVSIGKALGIGKKMHFTALEEKSRLGNYSWSKMFKFSIVRNPWDKVVSHYFFRIKTNQTGLGNNPINFKEWVKLTYGEQNPEYFDCPKYFMPQLNWLTDEKGEIMVDFVGRFENLDNDFQHICKRIGRNVDLPFLNKSERREYQYYYDDTTKEIVRKWFEKDIIHFNYSF